MSQQLYQEEIEALSHKTFRGDYTVMFYELIKESQYLDYLLADLNIEPVKDTKVEEEVPKKKVDLLDFFNRGVLVE